MLLSCFLFETSRTLFYSDTCRVDSPQRDCQDLQGLKNAISLGSTQQGAPEWRGEESYVDSIPSSREDGNHPHASPTNDDTPNRSCTLPTADFDNLARSSNSYLHGGGARPADVQQGFPTVCGSQAIRFPPPPGGSALLGPPYHHTQAHPHPECSYSDSAMSLLLALARENEDKDRRREAVRANV